MPLFRAGRPFILIFIRDVRKYQGKNKTQGKGLKIDFNDGMTCQTKNREKSYPRPLKTGGSPPALACLAAVAWHYCYNVTLYACRGRLVACVLRLAADAGRTCAARKIAILPIPLHDVRTLKNGQIVPAYYYIIYQHTRPHIPYKHMELISLITLISRWDNIIHL